MNRRRPQATDAVAALLEGQTPRSAQLLWGVVAGAFAGAALVGLLRALPRRGSRPRSRS